MKVVLCDDSHYEIFLNQVDTKNFDIEKKDLLEDYFKKIFRKLNKDYYIEVNGYYEVDVYQDPYYGMVLDIEKEDLDYYDFSYNEVNMRIQIEPHSEFLYEIEDPFLLDEVTLKKGMVSFYKDHFYFSFKEEPTLIEMAQLLEKSNLVYKNTLFLLKCSKKLDF